MRRETRNNNNEEMNSKIIKYSAIGVAILAFIVISLFAFIKNLNAEVQEGTLTSEQITNILNNGTSGNSTTSASSGIGKNVNEAEQDLKDKENVIEESDDEIETNAEDENEILTTNNIKAVPSTNTTRVEKTNATESKEEKIETKKEENQVELKFEKPVEGEIVREFAVEGLIYSETLKEWTTHTGIDIKANKTSVVKSAESGTVKSIKNDPRYGLTIIIEHENGFKTVYANLLSSEFVVEGEKVKKGQSLGTVGNTAAFEVADEPHLHFEILKDSIAVDPNIYLK